MLEPAHLIHATKLTAGDDTLAQAVKHLNSKGPNTLP